MGQSNAAFGSIRCNEVKPDDQIYEITTDTVHTKNGQNVQQGQPARSSHPHTTQPRRIRSSDGDEDDVMVLPSFNSYQPGPTSESGSVRSKGSRRQPNGGQSDGGRRSDPFWEAEGGSQASSQSRSATVLRESITDTASLRSRADQQWRDSEDQKDEYLRQVMHQIKTTGSSAGSGSEDGQSQYSKSYAESDDGRSSIYSATGYGRRRGTRSDDGRESDYAHSDRSRSDYNYKEPQRRRHPNTGGGRNRHRHYEPSEGGDSQSDARSYRSETMGSDRQYGKNHQLAVYDDRRQGRGVTHGGGTGAPADSPRDSRDLSERSRQPDTRYQSGDRGGTPAGPVPHSDSALVLYREPENRPPPRTQHRRDNSDYRGHSPRHHSPSHHSPSRYSPRSNSHSPRPHHSPRHYSPPRHNSPPRHPPHHSHRHYESPMPSPRRSPAPSDAGSVRSVRSGMSGRSGRSGRSARSARDRPRGEYEKPDNSYSPPQTPKGPPATLGPDNDGGSMYLGLAGSTATFASTFGGNKMRKGSQSVNQSQADLLQQNLVATDLLSKLRVAQRKVEEANEKYEVEEMKANKLADDLKKMKGALPGGTEMEITLMESLVNLRKRCVELDKLKQDEEGKANEIKTELKQERARLKEAQEELRSKEMSSQDMQHTIEDMKRQGEELQEHNDKLAQDKKDVDDKLVQLTDERDETLELLDKAVDMKNKEKHSRMVEAEESRKLIEIMKTRQHDREEKVREELTRVDELLASLGRGDSNPNVLRDLHQVRDGMRQLVRSRADQRNRDHNGLPVIQEVSPNAL